MKNFFFALLTLFVVAACSPKTGDNLSAGNTTTPAAPAEETAVSTPVATMVDLVNIDNDRIKVVVNPGAFNVDSVNYRLPRVVQGTYAISDFGSFVDSMRAYDYNGNEVLIKRHDDNTWGISNAKDFDRLEYLINDTFDIEGGDKATPFSPSGTNIDPNAFVLNLHGFIGYFEELKDAKYTIEVQSLASMKKSSALPIQQTILDEGTGIVTDVYEADRYFEVTDNPMFYGDLDTEEFQVGDIRIVLSVFSPNGVHSAEGIRNTIFDMMEAQKNYLGDLDATARYDIYLFLAPQGQEGAPTGFGALEHHTSTVVVLPESMPPPNLAQTMIDVVSHEFFHIVTPLNVHSEDVHYFDYYKPTFSKHLWMYEGVTEYFASHFQPYEKLQPREAFYQKMQGKIQTSLGLDDSMSFTVMSENVIDEPYASNYFNVYQKGALIGMCIDIMLREESGGERSMLSLMKELSVKYGKEKPFDDDSIIEEITAMTYPSIGEFLNTHVVGTTPIDYTVFFDKVGLSFAEQQVPTTFFFDGQTPMISANQQSGALFFPEGVKNASWEGLGIQGGDIIKTMNGAELNLANARQYIGATFQWTPETDVTFVVIRDGEEVELSGKVGQPLLTKRILAEDAEATEAQVTLRDQWLGAPATADEAAAEGEGEE